MSTLRAQILETLDGSYSVDIEDLIPKTLLTASIIKYASSFDGAVSRTVASRLSDTLTPADFGVDMTGENDSTEEMAKFFEAIQSTGTSAYLPRGTVKVSDGFAITSPVTLRGDKTFTLSNTNAGLDKPLIDIADTAADGTLISGFTLKSVSVSSADAVGIRIATGKDYIIENMRITGCYKGIYVNGASSGATIRGNFVNNTISHGYHLTDANTVVDGNYAIYCGGYGYLFDTANGAAGVMLLNNTNFESTLAGFAFMGTASAVMTDVHLCNNLNSTTPTAPGYYFDTYGKNILVDTSFSELAGTNYDATPNSRQHGFVFTPNNRRVSINNCQATFSGGSGIDIRCSYFSITGGDFTANALVNGGSDSGILVGAAGAVSHFTIVGVNTVPASTVDVNYQTYGIDIYSPNSTNGSIVGCVVSGTSAPIFVDTSPTIKVTNCPGYVNDVSGTVTIPAGSSVATVSHGMSATPTMVLLTVRDASYKCWVGTLSTTTFNVNIDTNATAATVVQYYAKCQ